MVTNWLFSVLLCALPMSFCVLVWRKSPLVKSLGRIVAAVALISVLGNIVLVVLPGICFGVVKGGLFEPCLMAFAGFVSFCCRLVEMSTGESCSTGVGSIGLFFTSFGFFGVWTVGIPILLCSFILRSLFDFGWWVREKVVGRPLDRGKQVWGVAILIVLSVVVLPILMLIRLPK